MGSIILRHKYTVSCKIFKSYEISLEFVYSFQLVDLAAVKRNYFVIRGPTVVNLFCVEG